MLQKKESSGQESLSIEEYLVRRKNIREESPTGRQGLILSGISGCSCMNIKRAGFFQESPLFKEIIRYLYHLFSRRGRREYMHRERPER